MRKFLRKLIILIILIVTVVVLMLVSSGYIVYKIAVAQKGTVEEVVKEVRKDKTFVEIKDISKDFAEGVVAIEDFRYYDHGAIELRSLIRALLINMKEKTIVQGGSTITQQVAKNLYFENEQSLTQKIAEAFISNELEEVYSKDDILEIYVNIIYYGDNNYGIKAASNDYFNKNPKNLSYEEATLLAGLPQSPSVYALSTGYDLAIERQTDVKEALKKYRNE